MLFNVNTVIIITLSRDGDDKCLYSAEDSAIAEKISTELDSVVQLQVKKAFVERNWVQEIVLTIKK